MDMLSPALKPWPNSRAQRGKYYGTPDPVWEGDQLVVMSNETWLDFGTMVENQRRVLREQNAVVDKQAAVIAQLTARLNAVEDQLIATRAARKKEKLSWLGLGPKVKSDD